MGLVASINLLGEIVHQNAIPSWWVTFETSAPGGLLPLKESCRSLFLADCLFLKRHRILRVFSVVTMLLFGEEIDLCQVQVLLTHLTVQTYQGADPRNSPIWFSPCGVIKHEIVNSPVWKDFIWKSEFLDIFKKIRTGAWEGGPVSKGLTVLSVRTEFNPWYPCKKLGMVMGVHNPCSGKAEAGGSLGLTGQSA